MQLKSNFIYYGFTALSLLGCGSQTTEKAENKDSVSQLTSTGSVASCEEPSSLITQQKAKQMVELYSQKLNYNDKLTHYVSKDIEELEKMLAYFKCHGKTHVKFYFGMEPFDSSSNRTVDRLTIFMEGAKECANPAPGDVNCLDDADSTDEIKPFDIAQPCPPPKCAGRSRYY